MADGDLSRADLDLAFAFSRSEAGAYRDAAGGAAIAAPGVPRFDHGPEGSARGLLIGPGVENGGGDRLTIDSLILPAQLVEGGEPQLREATVFHAFRPADPAAVEGQAQFVAGIERRAWYSRDAARTIDRLLRQAGHHLEIGAIEGFRENLGGIVRFRGQTWRLPDLLAAQTDQGAGVLADGMGRPIVTAGAEIVDG